MHATSRWVWQHLCGSGRLRAGDILKQPEQADVLQRIARDGASAFYEGPVAEAIAKTVSQFGGNLTTSDLAGYRTSTTPPLQSTVVFNRYTLLSMPPPSSGGIAMQQMLRMIDRRLGDVPDPSPGNPAWVQLVSESMKHAFADRARHMGDPDRVAVPVDQMLAADRIAEIRRSILPSRKCPAVWLFRPEVSGCWVWA